MRDSRPSLILFIVAGLLVMIAKIGAFEEMMLVTKPMVVPAIFYYYLQTKRGKINVWFSIALWSFFVSDMVMIVAPKIGIVIVMASCLISYLILIKFAIDDYEKLRINSFNLIMVSLILLVLAYTVNFILTMSMNNIVNLFPLYLFYGIILIVLGTIAVVNYLSDSKKAFFFFFIMALCMIVSDFFFCIYRYIYDVLLIDHINLLAQIISYFFMVKYFNARKRKSSRETGNKLVEI